MGEDLEDASNELMLADEEEVNGIAYVYSLGHGAWLTLSA